MTTNEIQTIHSLTAATRREELAEMKARLRKGHDRVLELDIEKKEQEIARLDRNHKSIVEGKRTRDAEEAARIKREREALERRLMDEYIRSAPGTTEAEARAALPELLHRYRLAGQDREKAQVAEARRNIDRIIEGV